MKNLLLITITTMLFLGACKPDEPYKDLPDLYFYLSSEQLAKTPYFTNPAFDTLTFLSNKGDTLVFAKLRTDTSYFREGKHACMDCSMQFSYYQTLRNTYQTLKGNGKFEVRHVKSDIAYDRHLSDFVNITFNNINYYINDYFIGVNHKFIIDSLKIDNITYFQVIRFYNNWTDSITAEGYINKDFGLFNVIDKKSNINWTLNE